MKAFPCSSPGRPVAGCTELTNSPGTASVTGPYVDPAGTPMMNSGGMEIQGSDEGMIGPGSSSIFTEGSRSDLVYHYYDAFDNGDPWVQARPLIWAPGGWPVTGQPLTPVPGSPVPLR